VGGSLRYGSGSTSGEWAGAVIHEPLYFVVLRHFRNVPKCIRLTGSKSEVTVLAIAIWPQPLMTVKN